MPCPPRGAAVARQLAAFAPCRYCRAKIRPIKPKPYAARPFSGARNGFESGGGVCRARLRLILVLTSNGSKTENRRFINKDFQTLPVKRRIQYIGAIKGISGIWVAFFHYVLAFFPVGYVGWGSGVADSDRAARYFSAFPASAFANSSFPLYTFFALVSFTLAAAHFRGGRGESVRRQAVKRYFRLMPPVLACTMICYALVAGGLMFNARLGELAPSGWSSAFYGNGASFWQALISGLFAAFVYGDGYYCSILWCMNVIFIGSYLSYGILLLFGDVRGRWLFYAAIFALCAAAWGDCAAFVADIAASWAASIPVLAFAVWLFYEFVELPSEKFAQWVWEKLR